MRHNDVIHLISLSTTYDEIGNAIQTPTERMVFANQFGVSSNEFYEASSQGLKPEKEFEIYSFEYQGESKVNHDGATYNIIRTQTRGDKTRIVCEKDVGNG